MPTQASGDSPFFGSGFGEASETGGEPGSDGFLNVSNPCR